MLGQEIVKHPWSLARCLLHTSGDSAVREADELTWRDDLPEFRQDEQAKTGQHISAIGETRRAKPSPRRRHELPRAPRTGQWEESVTYQQLTGELSKSQDK